MKKMIRELWYGNINPSENFFSETPNEKRTRRNLEECTDKFEALLSKELMELFEKREDLAADMRSATETNIFIKGFCLGARMMIEVYENDEGETV